MKNTLFKILIALNIIVVAFFTKNIPVLADGYKESIKCTYALPLDYNIGITDSKESNELIVTYDGNDDGYTLTYESTYNSKANNKKFKDSKFFKYMKGTGNGSKANRGEDYKTCPLYVYYEKSGANDKLSPITWSTFKNYIQGVPNVTDDAYGFYKRYWIEIDNGKFVSKKKSKKHFANIKAIYSSNEPYPMFLKEQVIDGKKETTKPKIAIEKYFNLLYGFKNDGNSGVGSMKGISIKNGVIKMTTLNGSLSLKKDYLNLANYSFSDYASFKKYALSDSIGNESMDANMTKTQWQTRQVFLYKIENYDKLRYFLQNDNTYKTIYNANYKDRSYNTMNYLINLPKDKSAEKNSIDLSSRSESAEKYKKNVCYAVCSDSTGRVYESNALSACTKGELYKKCSDCKKSKCANVPSSSLDSCMKGCYGKEAYQGLLDKIKTNNSSLEKLKDTLYRVSAPTLDINFDNKAEIDCDDVVIFHTIYVILTIAAPILVIVFGSLDYAKAVMASDIEKMEKSKKQFPKRLLLLIVFVLVPIFVRILISFTNTNTNLMECIISGS